MLFITWTYSFYRDITFSKLHVKLMHLRYRWPLTYFAEDIFNVDRTCWWPIFSSFADHVIILYFNRSDLNKKLSIYKHCRIPEIFFLILSQQFKWVGTSSITSYIYICFKLFPRIAYVQNDPPSVFKFTNIQITSVRILWKLSPAPANVKFPRIARAQSF